MKSFKILIISLLACLSAIAQNNVRLGKQHFKTIQEALNALDSIKSKQVILIKNGVYNEKLLVSKSNFTLKGESEKGVVIQFSQARDFWRCSGNPDDWGAAVLNVKGHTINFENLTVINTYGFENKKDTTINCVGESGKNGGDKAKFALPREATEVVGTKVVRKDGHQFAFRSFDGATRLAFKNCTFRSLGGDTVSPWDVQTGLYYFKNCTIEGSVDLYCPRGNAYAENCHFICHSNNAAIWHDGTGNKNYKTVLKSCTFEGEDGFKLGRFHKEAQFYLIDCQFPNNMADATIYWVTAAPKPIEWGTRVYFLNTHRAGGDYDWHKNNIDSTLAFGFPEWLKKKVVTKNKYE